MARSSSACRRYQAPRPIILFKTLFSMVVYPSYQEVNEHDRFAHTRPSDLARRAVGGVLLPADPDYEQARKIWNATIDRRPAVIAQCAGTDDVRLAQRFAREHDLEIAIRGGGHNIAGNGICDGGLLIDFSGLRAVEVAPDARIARVQPDATPADFDEATQRHGLATPIDINSTTGVAGLTLGGGLGWLTRRHGMTVDNLLSADVVTADGSLLHASVDENADLFWGLRGGGNVDIVTQFEFRLHPAGPEVLAGLVVYPLEQGDHVLRGYRELVRTAPESCSRSSSAMTPTMSFISIQTSAPTAVPPSANDR